MNLSRFIAALPGLIERWTAWLLPWRGHVIAGCLLAALAAASYAAGRLHLNVDVLDGFAAQLPWRQHETAVINAFPHLRDALHVTVQAGTPDRARALARLIHQRLPPALFRDVYYPAAWPFHRRQVLMYRDATELKTLAAQLAAARPWLARLRRGPGLGELLALPPPADALGVRLTREMVRTIDAHVAGARQPLSWRQLLFAEGGAPPYREHLTVRPRMNFEHFLPARQALQNLEALQQELRTQLHLDGEVLHAHRARTGLARGLAYALPLCALLVLLTLGVHLRPLYTAAAAALTLACGFALSAGWAAASGGQLHTTALLAVLVYAGVGTAWMVQYGRCRQAAQARGLASAAASARAGATLAPGALATLAGCFALALSPWDALAQPGRLAGGALLVLLLLCLSLLPALLSCLPAPPARRPIPTPGRPAAAHPYLHLAVLAGLAVATLLATGRAAHRGDALSVPPQAPLLMLADNLAAAHQLAARLQRIPGIQATQTLFDLAPKEQQRKAAILAPLARLYAGSVRTAANSDGAADLQQALQEAMRRPQPDSLRAALDRLHEHLHTLPDARARQQALRLLEADLTASLPGTMQALTEAVRGRPTDLRALPIDQQARWVSADDRYLVLAWPVQQADLASLLRAVRQHAPDVTGASVVRHEFERATWQALWPALALVAVAIALVLLPWPGQRARLRCALLSPALAVLIALGTWAMAAASVDHTALVALPLVLILGAATGGRAGQHAHTAAALTTAACAGILISLPHTNLAGMGWMLAVGTGLCALGARSVPRQWRPRGRT